MSSQKLYSFTSFPLMFCQLLVCSVVFLLRFFEGIEREPKQTNILHLLYPKLARTPLWMRLDVIVSLLCGKQLSCNNFLLVLETIEYELDERKVSEQAMILKK